MSRFKRNLAIFIGIDRYNNGISPLGTTVTDATAIALFATVMHPTLHSLLLESN
ncbi:MAG: hypothetical protein IGR76_15415 [Synechococcales cyanobacterium T60_A2020_003]|nr:hypothetical protein [Synechococcales cyanobacterium T60_A2020_003]